MTLSEWMRSVRAIKDTPVAEYSVPGIDSIRRVPYRRQIAVLPFHLILSDSNFERSLWRCGQLCPWIRMGSLGMCLHRDCNAMGDAAKISPSVPSTCAQNAIISLLIIHIIPSRQIYGDIDNPSLIPSVSCLTTSSYLWNDMGAANYGSHAENLQSNSCQCISHWYKFRDRIQGTWVFRYCVERQR